MVARGEYRKVDPRSTQILALATQVQELKGERNAKSSANTIKTTKTHGSDTSELDRSLLADTSFGK